MSNPGPAPPNGDENRQTGIFATIFIVTVVASVAVALRMATRIWIVRSVGWDDYTISFAAFGQIIGCALVVVEVHYGFGRHKFYLSEWQYIEFTKYSYGEWIQTFQTLMFNKLSICLFLLRIPVKKIYIRPIQGTMIFLIVTNIVLTLLWIFQCNPIARSWNKQTLGKCFTDAQLQRIIISQAIISIISDFILALVPIALLYEVQIAARTKAGLCTLMGLGLITAACCIVRTILNWQNVNADPTWASVDNWYWRSCEFCIGITLACIPALRPGYKTLTASINSYLSHRSARKVSDTTFINTGDPSHAFANGRNQIHQVHDRCRISRERVYPEGSKKKAFRAAAQAASIEADRAKKYGTGEEVLRWMICPETQPLSLKESRKSQESMSSHRGQTRVKEA